MNKEKLDGHYARRSLWEKVKANHDALDRCSRHDFSVDLTSGGQLDKKWKCVNCGGHVSDGDKFWYELGAKHAAVPVE